MCNNFKFLSKFATKYFGYEQFLYLIFVSNNQFYDQISDFSLEIFSVYQNYLDVNCINNVDNLVILNLFSTCKKSLVQIYR